MAGLQRIPRDPGSAHNATQLLATYQLTSLERQLVNAYQHHFPLSPTPYADIANEFGVSEALVMKILAALQERGVISRIGPVLPPRRVGVSTLAAMAIPEAALESVAAYISSLREVNHNYEREDHFNLWFVITAADDAQLAERLQCISAKTGFAIMSLPLVEQYHIDLGFPLWC
ncbi:MAG: Lrp/AsnC family transcriptional regulator [Gammaproteobacteria bacterium]|nr:Lrp/AsnC family transcriptional regulator [Gammaproteobacteria bacterium]